MQRPFHSAGRRREAPKFHSSLINGRGSHIIVVVLPQPRVITPSSLAASLREPSSRILTEHVQFPDFPEGRTEFLDTESINDGVDGRVAMREDDRGVHEGHGILAGGAEKGDAVEDVKWEPADCEEEEDQGQGLGELELLAVVTSGVYVASCYLDDKNIGSV